MSYKPLPSYDTLMNVLRKTISTAWHINTIHEIAISQWLSNFTGIALHSDVISHERAKDLEQRIALFLLCNFIYYNEEEVKHLMRVMLEKYIHNQLLSSRIEETNNDSIDHIINNTLFYPLGNQSESSSYMLYLFRQLNDLSKYNFEEKHSFDNIVFVDDFSITGGQADRYLRRYFLNHSNNETKNAFVLLMISTQEAINKIKSIPGITDAYSCIVMDNSSKAFSDSSIIFQGYSNELKEQARTLCLYYGDLIISEKDKKDGATALGFGDGGYLLGAYYNTPNNTLPIFWSEENSWKPIFKRYNKKYTSDSKVRLGGLYV